MYSNLGLGGIPTRVVDIVNEMAISHPKTTITILLKERRKFDLRSTVINPNVRIKDFYAWCPCDNPMLFLLWVWLCILAQNPTVILSFLSPYALVVLATKVLFFWRKPTILINEGHYTSTMLRSMMLPRVQRWGIELLYPLVHAVIVPTRAIMNDLHRSFGIPVSTMVVVPNWSRYAKAPVSAARRVYDVMYAGRFDTTKNLLSLLTILSRVIHVKKLSLSCLLVGEGPSFKECREFIASRKIDQNVSLRPPTVDVSKYLTRSKIFLFYPDKKTEGFPVAILDAMACETIVISKYFYGIQEVIMDNKNGFIVHTEKEMSNHIVYVLQNYQSLKHIIDQAKKTVSRHHSLNNIHQYTQRFHC